MLIPNGVQYHQKSALVHGITRYIKTVSAKSLLDIGAGSLLTAVPLTKQVSRYCAVEQDASTAQSLSEAGLEVIHGTFPDAKPEPPFDLVLASHSMPTETPDSWRNFRSAAWELTNSAGGMLLIVTFLGARGDLHALRTSLCGHAPDGSSELAKLTEELSRAGINGLERINSYVESDTVAGLVEFLGPWFPENLHSKSVSERLIKLLEARYRVRDRLFVFPIEHVVLSCRRP